MADPVFDEVNENSDSFLTVAFLDKANAPESPTSVTWEVHDIRTGTELVAATPITPAASIEITLPGATANRIVTSALEKEKHRVTVKAAFGAGQAHNGQYDYLVVNLSQVS